MKTNLSKIDYKWARDPVDGWQAFRDWIDERERCEKESYFRQMEASRKWELRKLRKQLIDLSKAMGREV